MERQAEAKRKEASRTIQDVPIPPSVLHSGAFSTAAATAGAVTAPTQLVPAAGGAPATPLAAATTAPAEASSEGEGGPSSKRRRRGAGVPVDYAALNAKIEEEAAAGGALPE